LLHQPDADPTGSSNFQTDDSKQIRPNVFCCKKADNTIQTGRQGEVQ